MNQQNMSAKGGSASGGKKSLQNILRYFAQKILQKYKPEIIGITGSVGKTSAKEAIYAVLASQYNVRQNIKSYNNEIGTPLTIIGQETGGRSIFKWLNVFFAIFKLLIVKDKNYPQILVLEMGADRVGDIDYLVNLAPPKIGVFTAVTESHLHAFKDLKGVLKEKERIVTNLPKEAVALLNADDENVMSVQNKIKARILTYGFSDQSNVRAGEILFTGLEQDYCETQYEWECKVWGTNFKVTYQGSSVPVFLPHCFGNQHAYAALAGIAVGLAYKMNLVDISEALKEFKPPKGRMNLIAGIKYTLIIDDTYNSSPVAVKAALEVLQTINLPAGKRKIAVLGDMLELGDRSASAHREIGFKVVEHGFDFLVAVGQEAKLIAESAKEAGMSAEKVEYFEDRDKAGIFVQNLIEAGDLILVKGSQGIRMEKIVLEIMAEPEKA
ncbi:MAG: UDP-N-acetylmuramoyl-tripeptide--D-alanyl-D-alanine ligase, partial [Candidatus Parcubacteria bacterium]|nr:UDP-N-acetylmuramoyl-tripeptide--D-alanyl-D-alanine ligase [Candidatus Parcubacteria bacterium]